MVDANKSAARLRVVNEEGDLYAARSGDGIWIKIGFSTHLTDRLRAINLEYKGAPFSLIASTRSTYQVELKLHRAMKPFHQLHIAAGKELYPACPAIRVIVEELIAKPARLTLNLDTHLALRRWCREEARKAENQRPAYIAHWDRFEKLIEAEERRFEFLRRRIQARQQASAA